MKIIKDGNRRIVINKKHKSVSCYRIMSTYDSPDALTYEELKMVLEELEK